MNTVYQRTWFQFAISTNTKNWKKNIFFYGRTASRYIYIGTAMFMVQKKNEENRNNFELHDVILISNMNHNRNRLALCLWKKYIWFLVWLLMTWLAHGNAFISEVFVEMKSITHVDKEWEIKLLIKFNWRFLLKINNNIDRTLYIS